MKNEYKVMVKLQYMCTLKIYADCEEDAKDEAIRMADDRVEEASIIEGDNYYYHDVSVTRCDATGRSRL